ncbi:hypothetical protein SAMN04490185_0884 [Pseudomonas frederiksbergensis]|jgi:hypothetical protein|uniref:Peptidase inhibitor I78 family protein n=1 Tax=Pseudomonas frederiksbergensis TaxID=104087 RepID=A0A1H4Q138_9PSED|nr:MULTISPECIES: hypothetical protein [Pseudomonas]PMU11677.1 peptidase inhibitor [Pseudomonas sp. FW305-20]PMU21600.1 peptidase inhibitor [Pseudomonas sp. FW305-122]PMU42131.1 peptidase inhibitor [Pseudomonas sp. FW305-47B]PMX65772.1 peptidase inhibitor [Pseudomonas sp. FW305-33]PMX71539.1 peptidase inhibitor [Pseudomonas sp. FW305-60]
MKNFLTTGLLAGLFLAVTLTSAHANEPEQSAQRCDARRVTYLIGEYLSRSVRDEAFRESRATSIKVNSRDLDPDNNRLQIRTDINLDIIAIYCG